MCLTAMTKPSPKHAATDTEYERVSGMHRARDLWLLWLAVAAAACLPPLGVAPLGALGVSMCFIVAWCTRNITLKEMVTKKFLVVYTT